MTAEIISNVFDSMASVLNGSVFDSINSVADVGLADVGLVGVFYSIADVRYRVTGLVQHDHT